MTTRSVIAFALSAFILVAPMFVFAQPSPTFGKIGDTVGNTMQFINKYLVPLIFALAFLMFIWGMFQYFIFGGASEDSRETGKQLMIWGVVAFVMMVSIWGLVNVIAEGLGFQKQDVGNIIPVTPNTR